MKEILFATSNVSKIARFSTKLLEKGILLKSLKDVKRAVNKPERGLWRVVDAKKRWINPQLTSTLRVSEYSGEFQKESEEFLKQDFNIWIGTNDEISYL